jgi:hypothetical protein
MGNRGGDQLHTAIQAGNNTQQMISAKLPIKLCNKKYQKTATKMMIKVMIKIEMQGVNKQQHRILNDQFDGQ